ncbi:uncharacterized protein PAC_13077 [Phialocephala subalpina]|uniref:Myb-like DNA-binding domain-containing protein n=1 Tax=Phialocephala subalpina TaxID=576137 RepID=A0A1L7XDR0_9HELO|nr:uncharacterized protein PAC_13077 [Phialocephala subalpina]
MPSKIQLDENLWFLYICLQKSDVKSIDFTAVGAATSLKPPAARMRYTRLRRQIESGTLIGTHGTPFASPAVPEEDKKVRGEAKKRKRTIKREEGVTQFDNYDEEDKKIKNEESSGYESDSSVESGTEESEDEMPLAKLSKKHMATSPSTVPPLPSIITPATPACLTTGSVLGHTSVGAAKTQIYAPSLDRELAEHQRAQAELQALIPTGRVELAQEYGGSWGEGEPAGGFWSQRYDRQMEERMGMVGGDVKPRKSV